MYLYQIKLDYRCENLEKLGNILNRIEQGRNRVDAKGWRRKE